MDNEKKIIKQGRDFLKTYWDMLDDIKTDQQKGKEVPEQQKPYLKDGITIPLIPPEKFNLGKMPLIDVILKRQSRRKYINNPLTLEELSFLLYSTQGIKKYTAKYSFRTVPSGGARHSFETYLYIDKVKEINKGLYRYLPLEHRLYQIKASQDMYSVLNEALQGQYWNAAVVFIWATIPYRTEWRYSIVAHKIIAIDAGHVCENLYLAGESIGCSVCAIGAYDQKKMDEFLEVDGNDEFTIYAATVGKVD